ncbi:unnamed protein product [Brassica rapa subsp. narinosa]
MLVYSKYPNGVRPSDYWKKKRKITLISCLWRNKLLTKNEKKHII